MEWRVIDSGEYDEPMQHALEEVLLKKMNEGRMKPTLRFWHRENIGIPIGRFQAYHDEVEHDYVQEKGIEVVRRITGGGAMYSEPGKVITYSIYVPDDRVNSSIQESYRELDRFAVKTLRELGADVSYEPLNDIEHEEGKIGGAAQIRKENAALHHTMMSYDMNTEKMLKALRIGKKKVSDKAIESAEKRVSRITDHLDHSRREVINDLIETFTEERAENWSRESLKDEEITKAEKLAEQKFSRKEWNQKL